SYDVTHEVHPENRRLLVRAARTLGMFWSGIDVQAKRIDRPLAEQDGVVIEVNDIPAFAFHGTPLPGKGPGVDMGAAIFRAFWGERRCDVPVVLVLGADAARARVARSIAQELGRRKVRAVVDAGEHADGKPCGIGPALDAECDAIVLAVSATELVERGLGVPAV